MSEQTPAKTVIADHSALALGVARTIELLATSPADCSWMVRGDHGKGKSEIVYQAAAQRRSDVYKDPNVCKRFMQSAGNERSIIKTMEAFWQKNDGDEKYADYPRDRWHYDMGLPVIERRLSQLQDGDMTGIPELIAKTEDRVGGTVFRITEWLALGSDFPVYLFLDEINRAATKALEQATFQICDSRAYQGVMLHKETCYATAVNLGAAYDTIELDPASISRYMVIDFVPSHDEWIDWATTNCHPLMVLFHKNNISMLEGGKDKKHANSAKLPDRRAWARIDRICRKLNLYETINKHTVRLIEDFTAANVGIAAAREFARFIENNSCQVSPKDVLTNFESAMKKIEQFSKNDQQGVQKTLLEVFGAMSLYFETVTEPPTDAELKNLAKFSLKVHAEQSQAIHGMLKKWRPLQVKFSKIPEHAEAIKRSVPAFTKRQ